MLMYDIEDHIHVTNAGNVSKQNIAPCNTGATFSIQPTYVGRILSLAFILNLYLIGQAYDVSAHEIVHIVMNVVLVFSLITFIHLFLIQAGLHPRICDIFK